MQAIPCWQTHTKLYTLFRKDLHEIIYPVYNREEKDQTLTSGTSLCRPFNWERHGQKTTLLPQSGRPGNTCMFNWAYFKLSWPTIFAYRVKNWIQQFQPHHLQLLKLAREQHYFAPFPRRCVFVCLFVSVLFVCFLAHTTHWAISMKKKFLQTETKIRFWQFEPSKFWSRFIRFLLPPCVLLSTKRLTVRTVEIIVGVWRK